MHTCKHSVESAIDYIYPKIHTLERYPLVDVDDAYCEREKILGRFVEEENRVVIKSTSNSLALAHEYGHWIYAKVFNGECKRTNLNQSCTSKSARIEHWERLGQKSDSANSMVELFRVVKTTPVYVALRAWVDDESKSGRFYVDPLLSLKEVWANAFAESLALFGNVASLKCDIDSAILTAEHTLEDGLALSMEETQGYWPCAEYLDAKLHNHVRAVIDQSYLMSQSDK